MKNYMFTALLGMIEEPNRSLCHRLALENRHRFWASPGASHNHQAWRPGGYLAHIWDCMNYAANAYALEDEPLPFTLSDALLVLFLHDLEKPWRYVEPRDGLASANTKAGGGRHQFRISKIKEYDIELTEAQSVALMYVEGEGDDYSGTKRVMNELAAFCHICDVRSARIRWDGPRNITSRLYL